MSEAEVFSDLYEDTSLAIYRFIYGLTGGPPDEVEDLTIETYLRAWKNRRDYHGEMQSAIGWLIRIARNLVIDTYRRGKIRPEYRPENLDEDLLSTTEASPEERCILNEDQQTLLHLLHLIPDEARQMLVLRYLLGWKVTQIAAHLAVPENTVSVTMRRSLERLRQNWPLEQE